MGATSIPVDLLNPGQVFACLGLLEAADVLCGEAAGGFDWSRTGAARFHLRAGGANDPVAAVLAFLSNAELRTVAPDGSSNDTQKWKVDTSSLDDGDPFPFPDPTSPATLPAELIVDGTRIRIDHWGDATRRDNVKFWAGSGGYPGAGLLRDALALARPHLAHAAADPFAVAAPQSSSFRFDWRRDYVPLGVGFSLNEHPNMQPLGFPLTEVLAAIGLTNARPQRPSRRDKLQYRYAVLGGDALSPMFLRAGLGCAPLPFPTRTFRMVLDWPGQVNQARCITHVSEEIPT